MAVALKGNLKDFGIAEVFQLIGQQRKTGLLEVETGKETLRLAFDSGAVVWASPVDRAGHTVLGDRLVRCGLLTREKLATLIRKSGSSARPLRALIESSGVVEKQELEEVEALLTRETIFDVLRKSAGSFHFSAQTVRHQRTPDELLPAEQILMDGMRMVDEWQTFSEHVPSPEVVFQRSGSFEVYRQRATGPARDRLEDAERLFRLVDGRLPAQRVIDLSRLGTFDATRLLAELRQAGLIELADPRRARARWSPGPSVSFAERARWWLAMAFPLVVLTLMVLAAADGGPHPAPPDASAGFAIGFDPLEEVRTRFSRRRMLHALDAYRMRTGSWPERLEELEKSGDLPRGTLTGAQARPYYTLDRAGGVLLLAPER